MGFDERERVDKFGVGRREAGFGCHGEGIVVVGRCAGERRDDVRDWSCELVGNVIEGWEMGTDAEFGEGGLEGGSCCCG